MDIIAFYGWWQLTVCSFAAIALLSIWYHLGRKQSDLGQVWLAASLFCWAALGAVELIYHRFDIEPRAGLFGLIGWRSLLSLCNSLFILLALPWFRYLPRRIESLVQSSYWKIIIGLPFLFSLFPTLTSAFSQGGLAILSELDVYYAIFTLVFLGLVLWESFVKRDLPALAGLTAVAIAVTLVAQLFKLGEQEHHQLLFSIIFKTYLIMIFFALALSWVKEFVEEAAISDRLNLSLGTYRNLGSTEFYVELEGVTNQPKRISLSKNQFELLHKFVAARKSANNDGWLEIKPRSSQRGRFYDINDHNEIKRLLHALLDGVYGVKAWNLDQEGRTWKKLIFELSPQRDRKIRLALKPEQLRVMDSGS